jgi:hypothetical protein
MNTRVAAALAFLLCSACQPDTPPPATSKAFSSFSGAAAGLVVRNRGVRWISHTVNCVPGVDSPTVEDCIQRSASTQPDSIYARVRESVTRPNADADSIACLRLGREIVNGDTTRVLVSLIGATVADGLVDSENIWVSIFPGKTQLQILVLPTAPKSKVAAIEKESDC